ncbi:hypothetical protein AKJ16_DCAP03910, partial [Drosera capensis]
MFPLKDGKVYASFGEILKVCRLVSIIRSKMAGTPGKGFDKFAPHNKHVPAPAAPTTTAQPSVPRILRSPYREAIEVSSTADSVVQTDSASGKPPVSGPSQNRPLLDLPRTPWTEVTPRNYEGGRSLRMMKTNDVLAPLPSFKQNTPYNGAPPTRQVERMMETTSDDGAPPKSQVERMMKMDDVLAHVLPFENGYLGVSNQASTTNTSIGAPPTGQAAANQNSHQQSPSEV